MSKIIHLWDRSRATTDWNCPRKRFWNYHYKGLGIAPESTSLELYLGTTVHDALAAIATLTKGGFAVDIDLIASTAADQMKLNLLPKEGEVVDQLDIDFANEQASLVEGLIRGFYRTQWQRLISAYPEILFIEQEMKYSHDEWGQPSADPDFIFMAKPDLILSNGSESVYVEYKTTSSKKEGWVNSWDTAVQLHSTVKAVEATTGVKIDSIIIQGLYKGYECLSPETPVLTSQLEWKPVGSLVVGEGLAAFEENSGNNRSGGKSLREWREAKVTGTGRKFLPCYEIELEDGTKFTCSANHQWLTANKAEGVGSAVWKTTEELRVGKARIVKVIEPWTGLGEFDPYDAGYLAAAFDGEGSLANMQFDSMGKEYFSLGLQFTQNPNSMLEHMKSVLDRYHVTYSETGRPNRTTKDLQLYGKIKVLSLLGKIRPKRLLPKLNFNKLGMIKDLPVRPQKVVSKTFLGDKEVVTLSTSTETFIANGFASHNSYGKQSSPMCYAYVRKGNPPFTTDQVEYEYKAGFKRSPTWLLEGGIKAWVESMPEDVLSAQFPQTPPIFINDALVEAFFRQRAQRERQIQNDLHLMSNDEVDLTEDVMARTFPQRFDQCVPGFGRPCSYRKLCHGAVSDPLTEGFVAREPHHSTELEQETT